MTLSAEDLELAERRLFQEPATSDAVEDSLGRIWSALKRPDAGEVLSALRPFAFLDHPRKFNGTEGECDTVIISHESVQEARRVFRVGVAAARNEGRETAAHWKAQAEAAADDVIRHRIARQDAVARVKALTEELERLRSEDRPSHPAVGWTIVPLEPTEEMLAVAWDCNQPTPPGHACLATWFEETADDEALAAIYRAMLAAAPTDQPALSGGGEAKPKSETNQNPDLVEAVARIKPLLLAFEDFINMPRRDPHPEPMAVCDYRHAAYREWRPLCAAILALPHLNGRGS